MADAARQNRYALLKFTNVLQYLRSIKKGTTATAKQVQENTGVDPQWDPDVNTRLRSDPKVRVLPDPDGGAGLQYQYIIEWSQVKQKADLMRALDNYIGIRVDELLPTSQHPGIKETRDAAYPTVATDVELALRTGEIAGIQCRSVTRINNAGVVLFQRSGKFVTRLSGVGTPEPPPSGDEAMAHFVTRLQTSVNLNREMERGEAVNFRGTWYRSSTRLNATKSVGEQMDKAKRPLSVAFQSASANNQQAGLKDEEYVDTVRDNIVTLDAVVDELTPGPMMRYGVTKDMRELWIETREMLPRVDLSSGAAVDFNVLEQKVREFNLSVRKESSSHGAKRRGPPKIERRLKYKRRRTKKKETNVHLKDTAIGEAIRLTGEMRDKKMAGL
mmetsp:Transcript_35208/g.110840  ORF Transcript_35208/g.110840 Transcript_35208/m.110840 type:complete len:387 (-) Transcript_35208:375-1535(-)